MGKKFNLQKKLQGSGIIVVTAGFFQERDYLINVIADSKAWNTVSIKVSLAGNSNYYRINQLAP